MILSVVIETEEAEHFDAEVKVSAYKEMYGEDADGLRGEIRTFITDIEILAVYDSDMNEIFPSEELRDLIEIKAEHDFWEIG